MIGEIISGAIGASGGILATFVGNLITSAKHEQRLDEHDRRFVGVDGRFDSVKKEYDCLDDRFVPRKEIDARLTNLAASQERIEKLLNLVLPYAIRNTAENLRNER